MWCCPAVRTVERPHRAVPTAPVVRARTRCAPPGRGCGRTGLGGRALARPTSRSAPGAARTGAGRSGPLCNRNPLPHRHLGAVPGTIARSSAARRTAAERGRHPHTGERDPAHPRPYAVVVNPLGHPTADVDPGRRRGRRAQRQPATGQPARGRRPRHPARSTRGNPLPRMEFVAWPVPARSRRGPGTATDPARPPRWRVARHPALVR